MVLCVCVCVCVGGGVMGWSILRTDRDGSKRGGRDCRVRVVGIKNFEVTDACQFEVMEWLC